MRMKKKTRKTNIIAKKGGGGRVDPAIMPARMSEM
jgi:hypothetical protein